MKHLNVQQQSIHKSERRTMEGCLLEQSDEILIVAEMNQRKKEREVAEQDKKVC